MEAQTEPNNSPGRLPEVKPTQPNTEAQSSISVPSLRFPRPQGNENLANWISSSTPDIMSSTHSDEEFGHDSSYELVKPDPETESQDSRLDESDSFDEDEKYPHPDEVQSVEGLDDRGSASRSGSDTEDDEDDGDDPYPHAPSLRFADEILANPSTQRSLPAHFGPSTPNVPSIAFTEPDEGRYPNQISVKHTVRELSEEETATIVQDMQLANPPKRLSAVIRQTMSQGCLSTQETLRVLYVGDEAARQEVVHKIASAITCSSSTNYDEGRELHRNTDGVYNIVPLSFGSPNTLDIELMPSTAFQIKVETCVAAEVVLDETARLRGEPVYSLTIDCGNGGKMYKSGLDYGDAWVQPAWSLPHVVVFYGTENDNETLRQAQDITWAFCSRHHIPTISISEYPIFMRPLSGCWQEQVDQHAVHLCLESRDPENPIPEKRSPIDLASFLNIDNRQMNKNFAFLTDLQEPPSIAEEKIKKVIAFNNDQDLPQHEVARQGVKPHLNRLREDQGAFHGLLGLLGLLVSVLIYAMLPGPGPLPFDSLSRLSVAPTSSIVPTSTATITINHTSTKTINIVSVETPMFGGLLSDKAQTTASEAGPQSTVCSVELYSGNEILIKLPSGTKTSWLAKGAIDVDVHRGSDPVKSRLSSIDEGILIEINQKDAYGVLNVSVVTTRKPKINETIAVNFGRAIFAEVFDAAKDIIHDVTQKFADTAEVATYMVEDKYVPVLFSVGQTLKDEAAFLMDSVKDASKAAQDFSTRMSGEAINRAKDSLRPEGAVSFLKDLQTSVTDQIPSPDELREKADMSILKAQIASKLWWLKVQGKTAEYQRYEQQAKPFLAKKHAEIVKARANRDPVPDSKQAKCPRTGKKSCRCKDKGLGRKWKSLRG